MHDKIIHNPKICLELRGQSVAPFNPVTIYRPLRWSNWPLGVDIDNFENHCSSENLVVFLAVRLFRIYKKVVLLLREHGDVIDTQQ